MYQFNNDLYHVSSMLYNMSFFRPMDMYKIVTWSNSMLNNEGKSMKNLKNLLKDLQEFLTLKNDFINSKNRILEYIGQNTMGILIFHKIVLLLFQSKLGIISTKLLNSTAYIELPIAIICVILSVIVSLIIAKIIRLFLPFLIGEKKEA